jgi:ribonuclease-3
MADLIELQNILGVTFKDVGLLEKALVHRSFLHEHPEYDGGSNERLEFLGDAVLGMLFADKLYRDFPVQAEGALTRLRSMLVRSSTLTLVAARLGLGKFITLGKGEDESGGRSKPVTLARAMEAVIGAIYIDSGIDNTLDFILRTFDREIIEFTFNKTETDFKSRLQEFVQEQYHQTPKYCIVKTSGPDHSKSFTVEVSLGDKVLAAGNGNSKKKAETEAARIALDKLKV